MAVKYLSMRAFHLTRSSFLVAGLLGGCVGSIDRGEEDPGPAGAGGGAPSAGAGGGGGGTGGAAPPAVGAGPMPLRRLTRIEYNNTVRDLFLGLEGNHASEFPADGGGSFGFASADPVDKVDLTVIHAAAERISKLALPRIGQLLPCAPATAGEDACARQFIERFGRRAYRRPLSAAEATELQQLHASMRGKMYDFNDALGVVVEAMLSSSYFLYRWELGTQPARREGALIRLSPHEVASRLSYFLWSTMPDAALFAAADAGALSTPAQIDAQVKRMLADPKARDTIASFFDQILDTGKIGGVLRDPQRYPEFTDALRAAMAQEVREFTSQLVLQGDGRVETLLAASYSFVNDALAKYYGISGVTGPAFQRRDLDPQQRFGLLTMPAILTVHADPFPIILRGALIRNRIICQTLKPPGDVPPPPPRPPGVSDREFLTTAHDAPGCAGCHSLIDHIGFGFDNYDSIGRVRTTDAGKPVATSGTVRAIDGADRPFANARELTRILATSNQVRHCLADQWGRFALGRVETAEDAPALKAAFDAFARQDFNMRELVMAIAKSNTFLLRTPSPGEVTQ